MIRRFSVSLLLSLCTPILLAQGDRGSIAGLVSDPSGSVIAGATIEAVNQATNLKADTVTTATGIYRLVALPVGRYTLTATVPGFQIYVRQDIQVQVNQTTIDIGLRVGQVAETVTVSGGAPLIQSESAAVGRRRRGVQARHNNYSAEYAHALGAITSFTMKSGTNLLYQIPLGQGHKLLPDGAAGKNFRRLAARPGECVQQRQPLGGDRSEYAAFL